MKTSLRHLLQSVAKKIGSSVSYLMGLVTKSNVVPKRFFGNCCNSCLKRKVPFCSSFLVSVFPKNLCFHKFDEVPRKTSVMETFL